MKNLDSVIFPIRKSRKEKPKGRLVEVRINQELNDALVAMAPLTSALEEYLSLKCQMEALTDRMKEVRLPIEEALVLRGAPMEIAGFDCSLTDVKRANFNLNEAKKHIRLNVLAPYISYSTFSRLDIRNKK